MTYMKSMGSYFRAGMGETLIDIPYVDENRTYVLALENNWKTKASISFSENKTHFADRLRSNYLVTLSDPVSIIQARDKFDSQEDREPALIITNRHPYDWKPEADKNNGIKILLYNLNGDEVVEELSILLSLIENNSSFDKMNWHRRLHYAKKVLKKATVVDILGIIPSIL
jgi:hypothetical protein